MDKDYANEKEFEGFEKLEELNTLLKIGDLGRTPPKYCYDASGYTDIPTVGNKKVEIEIKVRNQTLVDDSIVSGSTRFGKPYTATTLYIESHKFATMLQGYITESTVPLYVNFLNDGIVVVFNLSKIRTRNEVETKKIQSQLYGGFEISKRIPLSLSDGWIYKKNGNNWKLIHKAE